MKPFSLPRNGSGCSTPLGTQEITNSSTLNEDENHMTETKTWPKPVSTQEITNSSTLNEDENHITETKTWQQHFGVVRDSVNGYHVIGCSSCGFTHIVPLPTEEELGHVYNGEALKDKSLKNS